MIQTFVLSKPANKQSCSYTSITLPWAVWVPCNIGFWLAYSWKPEYAVNRHLFLCCCVWAFLSSIIGTHFSYIIIFRFCSRIVTRKEMANPKFTRVPSMRERVEDTLSAHRNQLVALLSRYINKLYILVIFFIFLSLLINLTVFFFKSCFRCMISVVLNCVTILSKSLCW